jgi:hypothetical protein
MNPKTSVGHTKVRWTPPEVHGIAAEAFREMAAEKAAAGDQAAALALERMASDSEAALDSARRAWDGRFAPPRRKVRGAVREAER